MPLKGFKSITIPEELYIQMKKYYRQHKEDLHAEQGIRSFTAFTCYCMKQYLNLLRYEQPIRILFVDDEQPMLDLTKEFLEQREETFQVDTTLSARDALQKLSEGEYDVVVSDYRMPVMNGLEFLSQLRKKDRTIPFIFFTGRGGEEIAAKAFKEGANSYIMRRKNMESACNELADTIKQAFMLHYTVFRPRIAHY